MAEAKKMMESPEWKKKMKELTQDKDFKKNMAETKAKMEDPNELAQMRELLDRGAFTYLDACAHVHVYACVCTHKYYMHEQVLILDSPHSSSAHMYSRRGEDGAHDEDGAAGD